MQIVSIRWGRFALDVNDYYAVDLESKGVDHFGFRVNILPLKNAFVGRRVSPRPLRYRGDRGDTYVSWKGFFILSSRAFSHFRSE